jgi:dCTP deaminase
MILSDLTIRQHLKSMVLWIDPPPENIQPASVDLHLGGTFMVLSGTTIDRYGPKKRGPVTTETTLAADQCFYLFPGMFVLAEVMEYIRIPDFLVGKLEGKSTLARDGLVVENAGYVDPGWAGKLTLELYNLGPATLILRRGQPICQIRFEMLTTPASRLYGDPELGSHYQGSQTVQPGYDPATPAEIQLPLPGLADTPAESST